MHADAPLGRSRGSGYISDCLWLTDSSAWRRLQLIPTQTQLDLPPAFFHATEAVPRSNRRRFQSAALCCYEVSSGNRRDRTSTSIRS